MTDAIELYEREDGQWAYRIKGQNGEIMAQSEGYANAFNANRGAQTLVRRLRDVESNVIASVDDGSDGPEIEIRTFDTLAQPRVGRARGPLASVVDATGMEVNVNDDEVSITIAGPKNKDSYRIIIKGENLKLLKDRLIAAENATPTKEAYLLSIISRAANYTATPPTIETLVEWVQNNRGEGKNPFLSADLTAEVREVIVDLFFARKIKTDNKMGLVVVKREGR